MRTLNWFPPMHTHTRITTTKDRVTGEDRQDLQEFTPTPVLCYPSQERESGMERRVLQEGRHLQEGGGEGRHPGQKGTKRRTGRAGALLRP
mmetsp:Transcript_25632/g.50180  ORF Transcript_25632/g.50180 Transcript_25632/m.50180 type:complete len:91 (-) Transcript_25632:159-431(-)